MKTSVKRLKFPLIGFFFIIAFGLFLFLDLGSSSRAPIARSEVGFASYSPNGQSGGMLIPASCESGFEHFPGECGPPPPPPPPPPPQPTSACSSIPYHRWYMDEESGTTVADVPGYSDGPKNGTAVGSVPVDGVQIIPGKFGNARNFNGTSDYINVGDIYTDGTSGTVALWVKPSGNNYSTFQTPIMGYIYPGVVGLGMAFGNSSFCSGGVYLYLPNGAGSYQTVCGGPSLVYNATNFPAGVWTHLAVTYDGTTVIFYKNGARISAVAQPSPTAPNSATFSIGRQGNWGSGYFSGGIDEVGLWRIALTGRQVLGLYKTNRSGIGLKAQESGATVRYATEPGGTSPVRIFEDGVNYGIILVDPSDPNASKARVQTSSGVKAFCKIP